MHWCEDRKILQSIFQFSAYPFNNAQNNAQIAELCALLLRSVQEPFSPLAAWQLAKEEYEALLQAAKTVKGEFSAALVTTECRAVHDIIWFPSYGCAVVSLFALRAGDEMVAPLIVGLDGWDFASGGPSNAHYSSTAHSHALLCHPAVPKGRWHELVRNVNKMIQRAEEQARRTGKRTAAGDHKGHQKTPAFICSVFSDVVQSLFTGTELETHPRGGFTDVGLHTGGVERDTCWALVREVAQVLLSHVLLLSRDASTHGFASSPLSPKQLVAVAEASMCLWLLERQLALLTPETTTPSSVTVVVDMLEHTALLGTQLSDCVSGNFQPAPAMVATADHVDGLPVEPLDVVMASPTGSSSGHGGDADVRSGIERFAERLQSARLKLEALLQAREQMRALPYQLPAEESVAAPRVEEPRVVLPAAPMLAASSYSDILAVANQNLGGLPILLPHASVRLALSWMKHSWAKVTDTTKELWSQLALQGLEQAVFGFAVDASASDGPGWVDPDVTPGEVMALVDNYRRVLAGVSGESFARMQVEVRSRETLMVWVAFCVADARGCVEYPLLGEFGVALRWEDLRHLVLGDRLAVDAALAVGDYLRSRTEMGLEVFTLQDAGGGWQINTMAMAAEMAEESSLSQHIASLWRAEQEDAEMRVQGHWQEVLRKQALVVKLREELADLERKLEGLQSELLSATNAHAAACALLKAYPHQQLRKGGLQPCCPHHSQFHDSCAWKAERVARKAAVDAAHRMVSSARVAENICNSRVRAKRAELTEAKRSPAPVFQPLPSDESKAKALLFLINMPEVLRQVAQLAFTAQEMLLPCRRGNEGRGADIAALVQEVPFAFEWHAYYNGHQVCEYHTPAATRKGSTGMVLLGSRQRPPTTVGPADVEQCLHKHDGIWHPDGLSPTLGWQGCGCAPAVPYGLYNPFAAIPHQMTVDYFTELLPSRPGSSLQWAMPQYGTDNTDTTRGNIAIAEQISRPAWMSKPQYLAFGALRAYPNQQVRKMCVALRDKLLPLDRPAVHTLLRMAAYHLGELDVNVSDGGSTSLARWFHSSNATEQVFPRWHTDLWLGGAADALCEELQALLEELRPAPRRHSELMILAEVAGYLGERHEACLVVARGFGEVARKWGDELEGQLAESSASAAAILKREGGQKPELRDSDSTARSRQGLFYMYALLCYRSGPLSVADARSMVALMVLVSYMKVFEDGGGGGGGGAGGATAALAVRCHHVMAGRVGDVLQVLGDAGVRDQALTSAFKLAVRQGVPQNLSWEQVADSRACFHARSNDGRLYSINVLTGTVLVDGTPPGRLPAAILEHPLYRAVFGDKSFEVCVTAAGMYSVTRAVGGRSYEFAMLKGSRLLVVEVDGTEGAGARLELLDPEEGWASDLPVRFRQLHSHWVCRDSTIHPDGMPFVVFRPRDFRQRQVSFLMECHGGGTGSCWRVPDSLCWQPCAALVQSLRPCLTQKLVLARAGGEDPLLHVLSKFEPLRFIHIFQEDKTSQGDFLTVHFHLPRLKLEFLLKGGRVESMDYRGYILSSNQQLVGPITMPEFTQYLVLERSPPVGPAEASQRPATFLLPSGRASTHGLPDTLVVMPQGLVARRAPALDQEQGGLTPSAFIERDDANCNASWATHTYHLHGRWPLLQAATVSARLQLAAAYAAPGSLAVFPGCLGGMAGLEVALALVRQCRVAHPLAPRDAQQLRRIAGFGVPLLPALTIACTALERSSLELRFLYTEGVPRWRQGLEVEWTAPHLVCGAPDAHTAYMHKCRQMPAHSRRRLTGDEAAQELGFGDGEMCAGTAAGTGLGRVMPQHGALEAGVCPVGADYVRAVEKDLQALREQITTKKRESSAAPKPAYPLSTPGPTGSSSRLGLAGGRDRMMGVPAKKPRQQSVAPVRTVLATEMDDELRASWELHHQVPEITLGTEDHGQTRQSTTTAKPLGDHFRGLLAQVSGDRARVERFVLESLSDMRSSGGWHAAACRMLAAASMLPGVTLRDMARMACDPRLIGQFNPFLSQRAKEAVLGAVLLWLEVCVLEDKVARLLAYATGGDHLLLLQELEVVREWDVCKHPHWLVFEAENGLQIRPKQHAVARHMMDHPGAIVQLNMGEGKTRVILPMLVLHWADGRNTVRLNFPTSLLDEAHDYLHGCLCAGVLERRLTILPFNRDVQITERGARTLARHVQLLTRSGGILLAAPEHRLSIKLKWHELAARPSDDATRRLLAQLDNRDVIDILDESDDLLHHRRELVYACGAPVPLPNGPNRWTAMQALLLVLQQGIRSKAEVWQVLTRPGVCVGLEADKSSDSEGLAAVTGASNSGKVGHLAGCSHGEFIPVRLVPGDALTACLPELRVCLLGGLMGDPPYELSWLGRGDVVRDARIMEFVTDPAPEDVSALLASILPVGSLHEDERASLLMLRGLLAGNLLFHELQKRHLVEYGVDRRAGSTRKKRLAVPFRAHNQPSDRSEWAHPDAALMLTALAYYHDGLTLGEMTECLRTLVGMAPSTQADFYNGWLAICERPRRDIASTTLVAGSAGVQRSSSDLLPLVEERSKSEGKGWSEEEVEEWAAIDMVEKVDLTNAVRLALIHRKLGRNMGAINFWLSYCLYPRETNQFAQRLSASAWDLAQAPGTQGRVLGFSGTNDLHRLMPLQVRQNDLRLLQGTSGKMLALLLREDGEDGSYTTLAGGGVPSWQATLDLCVQRGVNALLDAGAFLVGVSNRGAAEYLLPSPQSEPDSGGLPSGSTCVPARDQNVNGGNEERSSTDTAQGWMLFLETSHWQQQQQQRQQRRRRQQLQQRQQQRLRQHEQQQQQASMRTAFRERFPGVVYFDTGLREWIVRDRSGWCVPLSHSPIAPADAFVIYDESRCRGTDLKLHPEALALVTLSARMTKDKLMQAAGRMRQLDKGQRLLLVGNAELSNKVVKANGLADVTCPAGSSSTKARASTNEKQVDATIRPSHVMRVVMANTVEATQEGLVRASVQGVHFGCTHGAPHRALLDDDLALDTMYESALAEERASALVDTLVERGEARCVIAGGLDGGMAEMLARIRDRGQKYGDDFCVVVSQVALGGECERELEMQVEKEVEKEVQLPKYEPRAETLWDYASVLGAGAPTQLPTQLVSLQGAMASLFPPGLQRMPWAKNIFMTYNFLHGTRENDMFIGGIPHGAPPHKGNYNLNEFLRAVDAVLYFWTTGEALLLSEREADAVLALLWERDGLVLSPSGNTRGSTGKAREKQSAAAGRYDVIELFHLSYSSRGPPMSHNIDNAQASQSVAGFTAVTRRLSSTPFLGRHPPAGVHAPSVTFPRHVSLSVPAATSLMLFSGSTSYSRQDHREELHRLLRGDGSLAKELVAMRGRLHHFPRSDLERVALHYKDN
eukprot:jgi/Mesvir1/13286/Mv16551-RA.1